MKRAAALVSTAVVMTLAVMSAQERPPSGEREQFRFRSGVELINVTATVSDGRGRFVSGLRQDDFRIYEDGELRPITHFTAERVPVSLGIVLDTSGSMEGEKLIAAKQALQRFLFELLEKTTKCSSTASPTGRAGDPWDAEQGRDCRGAAAHPVPGATSCTTQSRKRFRSPPPAQPEKALSHHFRRQRLEQLHRDVEE